MNTTQTSFFIGDSSKEGLLPALPNGAGRARAFERILSHVATANESLEQATARLIRLAELAYGQRDYPALKSISDALQAVPYAAAQRAGKYYQAVLLKRVGDLDTAAEILATITAPRALLTLGTIEECRGNFDEASRLHVEAIRTSNGDGFTLACAGMSLAIIKSGDGQAALNELRALLPLVRQVAHQHPHLWFQYHNEVAVELQAAGEIEAARAAIAVAVASPIAARYEEWQATAAEIRQAEPSRIAVVVGEPQQEGEPTEARELIPPPVRVSPRRHQFIIQPFARALLNPRASPRAPPSSFGLL